ncbi:MAG TPA: hypothetical protein VJB56_01885 [Candidatus Paceibacterota bacterium]
MPRVVYVFGNPDIKEDSLPLQILPRLQKEFPDILFRVLDPNEEWDAPENLVIIDTVLGIDKVTVFDDLDQFSLAPRVSLHDFDAYANLRLLSKLGKLKTIKIIGVSPETQENTAFEKVKSLLETM